ncbi:aldose 1-epimerase family protein [Agromyces allii]|uniref:Aldose 1-epimerase family protein n=1 Tax=Agromyces allii TaxID=393607 RepID=A0ABN2QNF4_9MICO|nr:aldose 1-epimerase family protein [Agromyces allii]
MKHMVERGPTAISGTQYRIRAAGYEAVIASVGASVRVLQDDHGDLIVPYDADVMRPAMRGALLAPWPNRTAHGRYEFGGDVHQLPVNELDRENAAHGLVAWQDFTIVSRDENYVTLAGAIEAQPGYPWRVDLEVSFVLDADGLTQRVLATNNSREAAPLGVGGHPYLAAGPVLPGAVDQWFLELPADLVMKVSSYRLLPIAVESVAARGGILDFRERREIGQTELNHAFGGLRRDSAGNTRVRVTDRRGFGVELECDGSARWLQIYTADAADPLDRRHAVAVEPMTCPPDALNSKVDLITLEPGATFSTQWRIGRVTA